MHNKNKAVWIKPEIQVFVRGNIEESVLGRCKNTYQEPGGPHNNGCYSGNSGNICRDLGYGFN